MSTSGRAPTPSVQGGESNRGTGPLAGLKDAVKVDLFTGERDKTEKWLNQIQVYFAVHQVPANMQTILATQWMRGRAEDWALPKKKKFLDGETEEVMSTFQRLKKAVRIHFGDTNSGPQAERKIQTLRQTTSVAEYSSIFTRYSDQVDWDDSALMTMFRRGLKENIKDELARTGAKTDDLRELVQEAIRLDDIWYERRMEQRFAQGRSFTTRETPTSGVGFTMRDHRRTTPMELDIATRDDGERKIFEGKKGFRKNKRSITCYNCNKKGHMARECKQSRPREFNIVQHLTYDEAREQHPEWYDTNGHGRNETLTDELVQQQTEEYRRQDRLDYPKEYAEVAKEIREFNEYNKATREKRAELDAQVDGGATGGDNEWEWIDENNALDSNSWEDLTLPEPLDDDAWNKLQRPLTPYPTVQTNESDEREHASLSWTACYDDHCYTHMSDKMGTGWFPQKPRGLRRTHKNNSLNRQFRDDETPRTRLDRRAEEQLTAMIEGSIRETEPPHRSAAQQEKSDGKDKQTKN